MIRDKNETISGGVMTGLRSIMVGVVVEVLLLPDAVDHGKLIGGLQAKALGDPSRQSASLGECPLLAACAAWGVR